jgi:hypothetical protein
MSRGRGTDIFSIDVKCVVLTYMYEFETILFRMVVALMLLRLANILEEGKLPALLKYKRKLFIRLFAFRHF